MATDKSIKQLARANDAKEFVMLAHTYKEEKHFPKAEGRGTIDINGWFITAKLDGIRAKYSTKDKSFLTRTKRKLAMPKDFKDKIVSMSKNLEVDGELMSIKGDFNNTVSIARNFKDSSKEIWGNMCYHIFDIDDKGKSPYEERLHQILDILKENDSPNLSFVGIETIVNKASDIAKTLKKLEKKYEGAILRNPKGIYELGRSYNLLKVKSFTDIEVEVIALEEGEGKYQGLIGTLVCKMDNGKEVRVGTGMTDEIRNKGIKVGDTVTIKFFELTPAGIPRHPVFISVRNKDY